MKPSKLRKLQHKYTPETLMNLTGHKAILADRFYIPNEYIDEDMYDAYTTKLDDIEMEKDEFGDEIEVEKEIHGYKQYENTTAFHRGNLQKLDLTFALELEQAGVKILTFVLSLRCPIISNSQVN
jgi:hypothetical protein